MGVRVDGELYVKGNSNHELMENGPLSKSLEFTTLFLILRDLELLLLPQTIESRSSSMLRLSLTC